MEVVGKAVEFVFILAVADEEEAVAGILDGQTPDEVADVGPETEVADVAGIDQDFECHRAAGFGSFPGVESGAGGREFPVIEGEAFGQGLDAGADGGEVLFGGRVFEDEADEAADFLHLLGTKSARGDGG